jgi:hypothetical protein
MNNFFQKVAHDHFSFFLFTDYCDYFYFIILNTSREGAFGTALVFRRCGPKWVHEPLPFCLGPPFVKVGNTNRDKRRGATNDYL